MGIGRGLWGGVGAALARVLARRSGSGFGRFAGGAAISQAGASQAGVSQAGAQLVLHQMPRLVYAVGDVHGCAQLYTRLEAQIAREVAAFAAQTASAAADSALLVVLGDMIDRGAASAQVLDHLLAPAPRGITRLALMGNHEAMFLRFWAAPRLDHPWLGHGGAQMLASYGLDIAQGGLDRRDRLRHALAASIPAEHVDFIASLPHAVHLPGYIFAHAGINAARPLDAQDAADLLWGDPEALQDGDLARLGVRVVHGHRPSLGGAASGKSMPGESMSGEDMGGENMARADMGGGVGPDLAQRWRFNLDSGAYGTGRLTGLQIVDGAAQRFIVAQLGDSF